MLDLYTAEDAPGFAKHSSTFKNDDLCYEVDFIVGTDYDEVMRGTLQMFLNGEYIDYDVNYSAEGEAYVGVTCRDHKTT